MGACPQTLGNTWRYGCPKSPGWDGDVHVWAESEGKMKTTWGDLRQVLGRALTGKGLGPFWTAMTCWVCVRRPASGSSPVNTDHFGELLCFLTKRNPNAEFGYSLDAPCVKSMIIFKSLGRFQFTRRWWTLGSSLVVTQSGHVFGGRGSVPSAASDRVLLVETSGAVGRVTFRHSGKCA